MLCDSFVLWCVGKCNLLTASVHMQQNESPAGSPTHLRQPAAATCRATQLPSVSPTQPTAATSPLEAATAVPLPDSANEVVLTARKRGRPSKADLALRRQVEEQQSAAATAAEAAAPNTVSAAGAQLVADKDSCKSSKSSNPGSKATGSRASGSKGRKQAPAAAADADADDQADAAASKAATQPARSKDQARHVHGKAPCVCC